MWALTCTILISRNRIQFTDFGYFSLSLSPQLPISSSSHLWLPHVLSFLSYFSCPSYSFCCFCHLQHWNKCPFSYPPRVIRIPHFLWLGTGGAVSCDRWESDWNNWCRQWKRGPNKTHFVFLRSGEIHSENSLLHWHTSSAQIHGV